MWACQIHRRPPTSTCGWCGTSRSWPSTGTSAAPPPPCSSPSRRCTRQIRHLEQQLGARLLDRTPQGSRLTEAGEVFLPRAKALLRAAGQAAAAARAAAQPSRITIGYTVSIIVTPAVRDLRRQHPDADVHTLHLDWNEPRQALLDHGWSAGP